MKTWEMIKELTENPKKKFRTNMSSSNSYVTVLNGKVVWDGRIQFKQELHVVLDDEWEEVKEPVSFMQVIISHKPFVCDHPDIKDTLDYYDFYEEEHYIGDFLWRLSNDFSSAKVSSILRHGKFYIEEQ